MKTSQAGTAGVDVWIGHADAAGDLTPLLDESERARADRIRCARGAATCRAAHALKRQALSHRVPEVSPRAWRFVVDAWGKPAVAAPLPAVAFNLSHGGGHVAVAVADDEVGIDIESLRTVPHAAQLARFAFHPRELRWLARQPEPARAFLRLWTLKEALLKAAGTGFSHPAAQLEWRSLDGDCVVTEFADRTWLGATRALEAAIVSVAVPLACDLAGARLRTVGDSPQLFLPSADASRAA